MLKGLKIIWEWVKGACVIIVLFMILSGIANGMYLGEYDKGLFYPNRRKPPSFSYGDINQYRGTHGNLRLGRTCKTDNYG